MTGPETYTLEVPGAVLHYEIRRNEASAHPALLMVGSPMGASGFAALAGHFDDRTVVAYDPRGAERSKRTDGAPESTPDEHADDLHRLISAVGVAPVDVFASSGGAVNALALIARHPEQVRTLVAHEPPAVQSLPDRSEAMNAFRALGDTYQRSGFGPAMAQFIVLVSHKGPITSDVAHRPAPDPAMFGLPSADDGSRDNPLLAQNLISCPTYEHDFEAIAAAPTRVVVAAGADSEGELANRAALSVAEQLHSQPVIFPGGHGGFHEEGPPGVAGNPEAFAAILRKVLDAEAPS